MRLLNNNKKISREELRRMAADLFGNFVKAVVDVEEGTMVVEAELHADQEAFLLENGSQQKNLWGINLYPDMEGDDFIEFDSMINLRPSQNNRSRGVENATDRAKIKAIVASLIEP